MHSHTRRNSAAVIIAIFALFAALAGSAIALPGKNTVDKNDIKKNAVKTKTIKAGAVTEAKIKDLAVTTAKIADQAVTGAKIANAAVSTAKLADASVTTEKLADAAVTQDKVAADAIDSSKVEADSLTAADLGPGVISVVAFGKILNADGGANPVIAPGSVGFQNVTDGNDDEGRTTVGISAAALNGASLAQCSVQATPAADPQSNGGNSLGFDTVTVATGPPAPTTGVQVQTRGSGEVLNDFDYFLQVTCPNV